MKFSQKRPLSTYIKWTGAVLCGFASDYLSASNTILGNLRIVITCFMAFLFMFCFDVYTIDDRNILKFGYIAINVLTKGSSGIAGIFLIAFELITARKNKK